VEPLVVDVREAGRLLSVSPFTIRRMVKSGRIPSVRISRRLLIPLAALQSLTQATPREGTDPGLAREDRNARD